MEILHKGSFRTYNDDVITVTFYKNTGDVIFASKNSMTWNEWGSYSDIDVWSTKGQVELTALDDWIGVYLNKETPIEGSEYTRRQYRISVGDSEVSRKGRLRVVLNNSIDEKIIPVYQIISEE